MRIGKPLIVICALVAPALVIPAAAQTPAPGTGAPLRSAPATQEVVDEVGRHVTIPADVRRIVSLAPSLTETVYALGLQDRLVGDTDYCDYPPQAQTKAHVGGPMNPNLEQIVSLHPDLVLATRQGNRLETVEALTQLGLVVYATDPKSVEEVIESSRRLGGVLGARERGDSLALELHARLEEIKRRVGAQPARRVFFVVWPEPLISIGKNTFLADALRWAGAESVVETTQDWPRLNIEEVIRQQPEYLVLSSAHFEGASRTVDVLRERAGWRSLEAIRGNRIAVVSDAVNRPSPRLVDVIEHLARQLHPESFSTEPEKGKSKLETRSSKFAEAHEKNLAVGASFEFRFSSFSPGLLPGSSPEAMRCAR